MRRVILSGMVRTALALCLLTACAGPTPRARHAPPPIDDAVELAALLPDDVDRCVVARPRRLSARGRRMVLAHVWSEPAVYEADLGVVAYASAVAEAYDGRRARRSYYRFAVADAAPAAGRDGARARDVLHEPVEARARRLPVRWIDEPCEGIDCRRPVARWLDERTLEVARYEWPQRVQGLSSASCVEAIRAHADAFEVGVERPRRGAVLPIPRARSVERALLADDGLRVRAEHVFSSDVEAAAFERLLALRGDGSYGLALMPLSTPERHVERRGARVRLTEHHLFAELELAVEDERIRQRARALRHRRSSPLDPEVVDVGDRAVVEHQLALHRARMESARGEGRRAAAEALAVLLDRASAAHPSATELAMSRARLALDVLGRPDEARAVAERVLASGLADPPERWRLLRREALARDPAADALAAALADDAIAASAEEAARGAEDLRELVAAGVPYEWAESAWAMSRSSFAGAGPRRATVAALPWDSILATLVGLVRARGDDEPARVVFALRADGAEGAPRAYGQARPDVVVVRGPRRGVRVVGAGAGDLLGLRRLSAHLAASVPSGEVELALHLYGATERVVRVAGEVSEGRLTLQRVDDSLADVSWSRAARYLGQPLAELPIALFPPPALIIRAESAEVASALWRAAEASLPGGCSIAGPILRCQALGQPDALGDLLVRLSATRLSRAMPAP